jgi:hypothetical protein
MRYLLIVIGLLGAGGGTVALCNHRTRPDADMFLALGIMLGGLVCAAVGLATIDIVQAINNQRRQP